MAQHRIVLTVEGMPRDNGQVRLDAFVDELTRLHAALARLDKTISKGKRNCHFAIVGLSYASPTTTEIEVRVNPRSIDNRIQIYNQFSGLIDAVERDEIPFNVDYALLEDIKGLASPVGVKFNTASLKINSKTYSLTEHLAKRIDAYLAEQEECFSTVEGMLEKINVHDEANNFTVYPDIGPSRISCHFVPDLIDVAVSAIRRRVAISGIAKFRKQSPYPHHIDVNHIEIFSPEDELPFFDDLRGIAPDATGSLSSEEFIRELRNGWQ